MVQPERRLEPEHLWSDLKIDVQRHSPSNLTELERICREGWEKLSKYRCAKLVASYRIRLKAVIAAKGASTKYWVKGLNTYVNVIFQFLFLFLMCKKTVFALSSWGIVCRLMRKI